jgi:predicted N-acetyltransferase YhbS
MDAAIRHEGKDDHDKIRKLNDLAFGQQNEGKMIDALRKTSKYNILLSLVAEIKERIVGHILFYPIKIKNKMEEEFTVLSLAPLAVHPEYQNKGIGTRLVRRGLEIARENGFDAVIVVGHPNYYPRFEFTPASKWGIHLPFEAPDEAFLALELEENALKNCSGVVEYPKEYYEAM